MLPSMILMHHAFEAFPDWEMEILDGGSICMVKNGVRVEYHHTERTEDDKRELPYVVFNGYTTYVEQETLYSNIVAFSHKAAWRTAWLDDLYAAPYQEKNHLHAAMLRVFTELDLHFHCGEFAEVDAILEAVRVSNLPPDVVVSFLAASFPAKKELTRREAYAARVKEAFPLASNGDLHDAIDSLLK